MKLTPKKSALIDQVHEAFFNVPPPADGHCVQTSFPSDRECNDLAIFLHGKHWSEITSETIDASYDHQSSAIVFFLTVEGFHYFFPALLLISLTFENCNFDDPLLESAFVPFARFLFDRSNRFYRDRVNRFSDEQLHVIEAVFTYIW
jgi:hypothetical protein